MLKKLILIASSTLFSLALAGCDNISTQVEIKATLDGKPLAGAKVSMQLSGNDAYNSPGVSKYFHAAKNNGDFTDQELTYATKCQGTTQSNGVYVCEVNNKLLDTYTFKLYNVSGKPITIGSSIYETKPKNNIDITETRQVELVYRLKP